MRPALRWAIAAAGAAVVGCATMPPGPERLKALGPVAVVARVESPPVSRIHAGPENPDGALADRELSRILGELESVFETEVRFRGELVDGFGRHAPFRVVPPGRVASLQGSLLSREEGPADYGNLARAGVGGVLELTVERVELVPAREERPAGLAVTARARFVELAGAEETWSRELSLVPRAGSPLALDPEAPPAELERRYLEALAAAAREVGRETAVAFTGP